MKTSRQDTSAWSKAVLLDVLSGPDTNKTTLCDLQALSFIKIDLSVFPTYKGDTEKPEIERVPINCFLFNRIKNNSSDFRLFTHLFTFENIISVIFSNFY